MHHGDAFLREGGDAAHLEAVVSGRFEELPARMAALCRYAAKLTMAPWTVERTDIDALRAEGFGDLDIVDANQVVAYFNYVNRIADGLGVDLEDGWPEETKRIRHYTIRSTLQP